MILLWKISNTPETPEEVKGITPVNTWEKVPVLTPKQAEDEAKWVIEKKETKDTVEMLNEIIKAFDEDKEWKLNHLRAKYDITTNKIMASYNTAIKDIINNNENEENKEDMNNKNNIDFSSIFSESEERTWDETEWVNALNKNTEFAQYLSDEIMRPPQDNLLKQISDINEVMDKWSEENKKILNEVISQSENAINYLYHEAWLDKIEG